MAILKQFSVRVPNKRGQLAELCKILKDDNVNILAISVHDSTDSGIIRFVADKPDIIDDLLTDSRFCYDVKKIVMVTLKNIPGSLWKVSRELSKNKISIDYLYTANHPEVEQTVLAISCMDPKKADQVLRNTLNKT